MLSYRPAFEYQYGPPDSPTVAFGATVVELASSHDWASDIVAHHPAGSTVTAYIDPGDPRRGFVDRRVMWFPLIFMTIPVGIIFLVFNAQRWSRRQGTIGQQLAVPIVQ
jgi:hypothetical protein